jgi:hypothetical protein
LARWARHDIHCPPEPPPNSSVHGGRSGVVPPHWHTTHDEHHTALKGTLTVIQDGVRRVVRPEDGPLLTRRGVVHSLEILPGEEGTREGIKRFNRVALVGKPIPPKADRQTDGTCLAFSSSIHLYFYASPSCIVAWRSPRSCRIYAAIFGLCTEATVHSQSSRAHVELSILLRSIVCGKFSTLECSISSVACLRIFSQFEFGLRRGMWYAISIASFLASRARAFVQKSSAPLGTIEQGK